MSDTPSEETGKKLKILVIEDDTLTRTTLCNILNKLDFTTYGACNGFMGMKLFNQFRPDLVVTDLLMPDKEGLTTIAEIRAFDPHVKIIAMSSGGSMRNMGFLDVARKIGANGTLSKPFTPRQILELMNNLQAEGI